MDLQDLQKQKKLCVSYFVLFPIAFILTIVLMAVVIIPIIVFREPTGVAISSMIGTLAMSLVLSGVGIAQFVIYILILVGYNKQPFKNDTHFILLILGIFIGVANIVGVALVMKEYNSQISQLMNQQSNFTNNDYYEEF